MSGQPSELLSPVATSAAKRQAQRLRRQVLRLVGGQDDLVEWNTLICPDCRHDVLDTPDCLPNGQPHLPPLYYALAPTDATGDRALGMGASAVAALADLLWNLKANLLLDAIHHS